jgi:CRISPR/Cas system CSM-associated protein Csm3 (group 7 of RAMP superfamily)
MSKIITGVFVTRTALHVGSGRQSALNDDLWRRTAAGELFIPGSAIAGPLRALATRLAPRLGGTICQGLTKLTNRACECMVCQLFGDINPQPQSKKSDGGKASLLWVKDADLDGKPFVRDGVGIDRYSGAAARQVKFDLELLPASTSFRLQLELQASPDERIQQQNEGLLAVLLAEWEAGRGTIGGRVARGLGAFQLQHLQWYQRALNDEEALMAFLLRAAPPQKLPKYIKEIPTAQATYLSEVRKALDFRGDADSTDKKPLFAIQDAPLFAPSPRTPLERTPLRVPIVEREAVFVPEGSKRQESERNQQLVAYAVARCWADIEFVLQFDGPMLINDLVQATRVGFDHAPLADEPASAQWVLPGSSLRGVLRSQAERIARTITTLAVSNKREFFERNPAGDPNNSRSPYAPLPNSDCLLREEGIFETVRTIPAELDLADQLFGCTRMGSRLMVEDGLLANKPRLKAFDFLAIDRFTGGGRDKFKFDALTLWQPAFQCRIRLENPAAWELGWLILAARDIHQGFATIGFGAAKGFGEAKIKAWTACLGYLDEKDLPLSDLRRQTIVQATSAKRSGVWRVATMQKGQVERAAVQVANDWIGAFQHRLQSFRRDAERGVPPQHPEKGQDSYFDVVDHLYLKEVTLNG